MNILFSPTEIKQLKSEIRNKKRKGYEKVKSSEWDSIYSVISNLERHNNYDKFKRK